MAAARPMPSGLHVGTSGWAYDDWAGRFYPDDLSERRWLEFYQGRFGTVELNVTFYRLPREIVFDGWARRAPEGFRFAVKGPRLVTHYHRLRGATAAAAAFVGRAERLGAHLGPILWQLPPALARDDALLDEFLAALPRGPAYAFEFRHASWFAEPVYGILRRHEAAFTIWHMPDREAPAVVTARHVYLRFHGAASLYGGRYPRRQLARRAARVREWLGEGREVWAYFNNDVGAHAPEDARRLIEIVRGGPAAAQSDTSRQRSRSHHAASVPSSRHRSRTSSAIPAASAGPARRA